MSDEQYWDAVETYDPDQLRELQLTKLQTQLLRVGERSTFYRQLWAELGFDPAGLSTLEELSGLPVVGKAEYVEGLAADTPWGEFLAVDPREARRVHFSSGTTGSPTPVCWTQPDLDRWADLYARAGFSQGVRDTDVYQCLFGFSWFVGGLGGSAGFGRIGATVIPAGSGDTARQLDTIAAYATTSVSATPSFALYLAEVAEQQGRPLAASTVRHLQVGGEPGACVPATRAVIEERWGARCYDGYGSLEFQPIAWECAAQAGGHLAEDFAFAEIVDGQTGEAVPDGTPGVLVLTHLDKQACPLVRWWTGDVVVRDSERCECGRTHARLVGGVLGRHDDMLVIRGVNLFPSAVEQLVRDTAEATGEFQIVISARVTDPVTGYLTGIGLRVETATADREGFAAQLAQRCRAELTVRCDVEAVEPGSLPRSTHKSRRVVREP